MLALLQRVTEARVSIDERVVGHISIGLLVFVGVEKGDGEPQADRMLERVLGYRMFSDGQDRMNLSVTDIQGGVLLVPQFTLPADTRSGMRPSLSPAAPPDVGRTLFAYLLEKARARHANVASGEFGAHMQVSLTNDGPVTFMLQVRNPRLRGEVRVR
jgi:D-tyrosyl-tRNA(Tyr) deacylase